MASIVENEGPNAPLSKKCLDSLYNPLQLAAITNYKLAQLTFAPPNLHSLRKTAVVKNMLEDIYSNTPPEWLQQMTRWQFFTPESLEEMTQQGLEEIFAQYAQTIEAFREAPAPQYEEDYLIEDDDDDFWNMDSQLPIPPTHMPTIQFQTSLDLTDLSMFSQPDASTSVESINSIKINPSLFSDKPLPANPPEEPLPPRRPSHFSNNKNRMSWRSDTGVTSNAVSQNLANELMNLFDMNFSVDIKIDTAPKLPELPFNESKKTQHRLSQDMLTSLLPEFEKIALVHSRSYNPVLKSVPLRSSSLKHKQEFESSKANLLLQFQQPQPSLLPSQVEKPVSKKRSILRLVSLIKGKKNAHKESKKLKNHPVNLNKELPLCPDAISTHAFQPSSVSLSHNNHVPRKTSTSTVESLTSLSSLSWSSSSESAPQMKMVHTKA